MVDGERRDHREFATYSLLRPRSQPPIRSQVPTMLLAWIIVSVWVCLGGEPGTENHSNHSLTSEFIALI